MSTSSSKKTASPAREDQFSFERLLSNISNAFINFDSGKSNSGIRKAMGLLGTYMKVDRAYIMLYDEGRKTISEHFTWSEDHIENTESGFQGIPVESFPWFLGKIDQGEIMAIDSPESLPKEGAIELTAIMEKDQTLAFVAVPLIINKAILGLIAFDDCNNYRKWSANLINRLKLIGEIFANGIARKQSEDALTKVNKEIRQLKDQLQIENAYLKQEIKLNHNFEKIIGWSGSLKRTLQQIEQVAPTDATVLILGETGTGKELMARAVHDLSKRKNKSLVKINCAALPTYLIESTLFGHEKGAFTGATAQQLGHFELADGATIFLDEIGEMPLETQVKLLRVLQEGEFERVGNPKTIKVNVRIIAATNRDLLAEVKNNKFRSDLYYRLNVFPIHVPPLRERREDIPYLVRAFASSFGKKIGKSIEAIPKKLIADLQAYSFPGNVRELENIIERAVITSPSTTLQLSHWNLYLNNDPITQQSGGTLKEVERNHILQTLADCKWKIEGINSASVLLGLNPSTLRSRMHKLGIKKPS